MRNLLNYFYLIVVQYPRQMWAEAEATMRQRLDARKLSAVINLARKQTQMDKKHRYILRDADGNPIAVTALQLDLMKKKGEIPKHTTCVSVYSHSIEIIKIPAKKPIDAEGSMGGIAAP